MSDSLTPTPAEVSATMLVTLVRRLFALDHDPAAALPVAQLRVCILLYQGPRALSAISRELGVSLSAMTQIADRLERAKLVQREAAGSDRRVRRLRLTRRGERIMRQRETARVERVAMVLNQLPESDRAVVETALGLLLEATGTLAPALTPSTSAV